LIGREFSRIISEMKENGAEAVILGCTEIGLLIKRRCGQKPGLNISQEVLPCIHMKTE